MALDLTKFLARFTEEAGEHLKKLNEGILGLEKNPGDTETLNEIFRSAHTLKGSSRMMKLLPITEVAHRLEEVLDGLRSGKIAFSKDLSDLLFTGVDAIEEMVGTVASGGRITKQVDEICEALERGAVGGGLDETVGGKGEGAGECERESGSGQDDGPKQADGSGPSDTGVAATPEARTPPEPAGPKAAAYESVRISTDKLDGLIKLVGELVSGQSRLRLRISEIREMEKLAGKGVELAAHPGNGRSNSGADTAGILQGLYLGLTRLAHAITEDFNLQEILTRELQGNALGMRMLPLSTLFETFSRMVRDISRSMGKKVELVIEGGETELDKKMIEKIGDPLIHMIRNAVYHGIEDPETRRAAGKPETGMLRLSARYDAETVLIELSDDGAGIPLRKIRQRALQRKMFTADELDVMPESELIGLIFHPGFSTSEIVTDISGRGVGMDVVKKNIVESLKGSISIETREGRGTAFTIRLLLTLAIMNVSFIEIHGQTFAIPTNSVSEILRVRKSEVIDVVDRKAIRIREQIVPIVNLGDALGIPPVTREEAAKGLLILIVSIGGDRLGLVIDSILDQEDMVIKPLPPHMQNVRFVSAVTITGNNEIVNVLNASEIIDAARERKYVTRAVREEKKERGPVHILVVDDSINTREIERSILEAYGFSVSLAGDGMEALEKIKEMKFDVVVTDVEMPRMDGFTLTERLRMDEEYMDTPVILVTSRDKEEDKRRGIQVGANAYIIKGAFDQSNLIETIKNFVG